jgi:hypothetical protein
VGPDRCLDRDRILHRAWWREEPVRHRSPFSQQAWFFISGYDPSYTDPRGRFVYVGMQYKFK